MTKRVCVHPDGSRHTQPPLGWEPEPVEEEFSIWVCSAIGHGYHDTDHPCPDGIEEA